MTSFGIVVFPGSNCDHDIFYVVQSILKQKAVELWHKDTDLKGCDMIIIPGGFAFGDYLRAGALSKVSPIMKEVTAYADGGGYVLGSCNGFQVLCEAGLLPGVLLANSDMKFICRNVFLKVQNSNTILTSEVPVARPLKIPIAHAEGRYYADEKTIDYIKSQGQILFRYCNELGEITDDANPNGSIDNIAGICNKNRNVFGLMPHPERASDLLLGNTDGLNIFESILKGLHPITV